LRGRSSRARGRADAESRVHGERAADRAASRRHRFPRRRRLRTSQRHRCRDGVTLQRATFRERLAAFALDVVVVLITAIALDLLEFRGGRNFVLLLLLYHVAFWAAKGTTIGGIICQLRLVRADGQPLQLGDAFIRGLAGILSGVVAGLGFLWMLKAPERETWHDKIAGTMVVKVPRHL
jgi:uncharacterized RDD family membrane protein YckC